ncbi:MAG: hypothetical protein QCH35_04445 [Methanomicrobiaceae archaeon]|nr:hypothetical protein [Methanomicrobiaceae archaeon]
MDERAVSESIGFIIIFSIVVAGIGLVSLYGYPMLLQHQIGADERTMEQTMITIQNDIKLLTYSNVPYKDTALRVSGGALTVYDMADSHQEFEFKCWNGTDWEELHFSPGELRYVSDQGTAIISFENGAVVKRQQDASGSVMLAEPRWFYDNRTKTLVIFQMGLAADRDLSLNGIGNLQMSRLNEPDVYELSYGPTEVKVKYTPDGSNDYSQAWHNYFKGSSIIPGGLDDPGDGYYVIDGVSRVIVKQYNITVTNI